ncbi:MAG: Ldh family oxidoreductase [Limisphaerales bacterium]
MSEVFHIVPEAAHDALVSAAFAHRGFQPDDVAPMVRLCGESARHGIRTHNAIKALHLDHLFGSAVGGCVPGAEVERLPSRFPAAQVWDAHRKLGPAVAYAAMDEAIRLADQFGSGTVAVDGAWHYLWGGAYVLAAARRGFIGYTNCTATLAEVVPHGGTRPTLGTNPHSWAFPTQDIVGFPVLVDWATSAVAMGRVQQLKREGKTLPPGSAVDAAGRPTTDPAAAAALLPFGAHKGYGLGLLDELFAAYIGGSRPTLRGKYPPPPGEKASSCFFFQAIHPDALAAGRHAAGRTRDDNVKAVLDDILGPGNEMAILPGALEARHAARCAAAGGLLFSTAELEAFNTIAAECGAEPWDIAAFRVAEAGT